MNEDNKDLLNEIQDAINKHKDINSKVDEGKNDPSPLRYLNSFPDDSSLFNGFQPIHDNFSWTLAILVLTLLNNKPEKQEQPIINIYLNTDSKPEVKNGN